VRGYRPAGYVSDDLTGAKVEAIIRARLARGGGIKKVAKALGVGNGTVARIKMAMPS
jgi:hypothetical protein